MTAAFLGSIALAGCGDDSGKKIVTGGDMHVADTGTGDAGDMVVPPNGDGGDGGGGEEDFEDFVIGLIKTQTSDSTVPTTINDKTFTDSMDPSKFTPLF